VNIHSKTLAELPSLSHNHARYDTLSRPTSVTIPELANSSGTNCAVTYTYDSNSNVLTQTAPAPNQTSCTSTVTITFYYDALNRLTKKTYSDSSPTVQYGYDGAALAGCATAPPSLTITNPRGRRTSMCDSSGAASWSYDSMGRVLAEARTILGVTKNVSYSYNRDGSIATVTYPSNNVITYTVSNAQRLTAVNDVANSVQFSMAASYVPPGGLAGIITGQISGGFGGITESHTYNSSLEYTSTQATSSAGTAMNLTLNYNLSGGDNGTVTTVTNNVDSGRTQSFSYDPLNRIGSATTQATSGVDCWGQNFGPDPLANLNSIGLTQCSGGTLSVTVDANNHINIASFAYDAAGNMTQDGSGYTYTFDDENHLTVASGMANGPYCYVYDGNGLRVAKKSNSNSTCSTGTVTKLYWRSAAGDALAETDGSGSTTNSAYNEYVFFAGRRIAQRTGTGAIFYYFADQLGSTRTITTGSGPGQTPGQLCYDADFTPYGQEISHTERLQTTACPPNYKFTGYERDPETTAGSTDSGLDYAFARYYSSRLGRFLSADPLGGSIGNLQSHNAYAYTKNNPLNSIDPSGMDTCNPNSTGPCTPPGNWDDMVTLDLAAIYGGYGGSCTIDAVPALCSMAAGLARGDALAGVSNPLPNGPNGPMILWLSGGSITTINHNDWGGMMDYSSETSSFDGEWVTLGQFIGMVKSYYAGLGILSDNERLKIVARGVVKQAGAVGDWRFVVAFYVTSFGNAAVDAVLADIGAVEEGQMFGTRFDGNYPLFNTGRSYRIGWQYFTETQQYFFRININGVHIYLSPSWYF
jgi:RHS repeat-associated protein